MIRQFCSNRFYRHTFKDIAMLTDRLRRAATLKWGAIAWLIGLPLPIVLIALLFFNGCR